MCVLEGRVVHVCVRGMVCVHGLGVRRLWLCVQCLLEGMMCVCVGLEGYGVCNMCWLKVWLYTVCVRRYGVCTCVV